MIGTLQLTAEDPASGDNISRSPIAREEQRSFRIQLSAAQTAALERIERLPALIHIKTAAAARPGRAIARQAG